MSIYFDASQNFFHLSNNEISYIIGIEKEQYLTHRYFGPRLAEYHQVNQLQMIDRGFATNPISEERTFSLNTLPLETSTQGSLDYRVSNYQFGISMDIVLLILRMIILKFQKASDL